MAGNVDLDPSTARSSGLTHLESPDGRSFVAHGPVAERPVPGDYLEIEGEDGLLAFVEDVVDVGGAGDGTGFSASGTLVPVGGAARSSRPADAPWHDALVRPTRPDAVQRLLSGSDPELHLGHLTGQDDVGVALVPNRLNRHTFWCGQSGSGKTYALGVLLERILLTTRLPMLVLATPTATSCASTSRPARSSRARPGRCGSARWSSCDRTTRTPRSGCASPT